VTNELTGEGILPFEAGEQQDILSKEKEKKKEKE